MLHGFALRSDSNAAVHIRFATRMSEKSIHTVKLRTVEAFKDAPSLHPLVVGHMCKQDKNGLTFSKRYFALYKGGLLVYYSHEKEFENDVKKHQGIVSIKIEFWQCSMW